jgi:hypothetical protein
VEVEPGVLFEPVVAVVVLVGAVVVDDQVEVLVAGELAVEGAQET